MGPSCSGSQSESRIRYILPARGFSHTVNVDILVTLICSNDTKNSEITKCTENISFVLIHGSWKDEMGIVPLRIILQAKGSSPGPLK